MNMDTAHEKTSLPTGAGSPCTPTQKQNSLSWADQVENAESSKKEQQMARFFIIKLGEGTFSSVSPFFIQKCIHGAVGDVKSVKKLRSGDLLVEVSTALQATQLMKVTTFGNKPVSVSPHGFLNCSRGVISEADLLHISEQEILENMRDQLVSAVRRITIRRDGEFVPTKHLILTFDSPKLPTNVTAGYLRCPVRPYVPNPLRCFQCQRYGHSKVSCRGSAVCARCAKPDHSSEDCNEPPKCVNCHADHPSFSRSCPKWIAEKEVQTLRAKNSISYLEARKIVEARTPRVGVSYAAAAASRKTMCTTATQTDSTPTPSKSPTLKKKLIATSVKNSDVPNSKIQPSHTSQPSLSISKILAHKKMKRVEAVKRLGHSRKGKDPRNLARIEEDSLQLHPSSSDFSDSDTGVSMDTTVLPPSST